MLRKNAEHLYFNCSYIKAIWKGQLLNPTSFPHPPQAVVTPLGKEYTRDGACISRLNTYLSVDFSNGIYFVLKKFKGVSVT